MKANLKTIAFCCLGTGGVGFPTRIAARIALQEVREFLDAHPKHSFERIVFCVYEHEDFQAYYDYFSNFFPPTQDDLDIAVTNKDTKDASKLSELTQESYRNLNLVIQRLERYNIKARNMGDRVRGVTQQLSTIAAHLDSFKAMKFEPSISRTAQHIELLCSVTNEIGNEINGLIRYVRSETPLGMPRASDQTRWDNYNESVHAQLGLSPVELVDITHEFTQHLNDVLVQNITIPHEMKTIGIRLGGWLTQQTRQGPQSTHNHFEEVMLVREYQKDAPVSSRTDIVPLHRVPTLAQLYEQSILPAVDDHVKSSVRFNDIVCFTKEDITRIEVDIFGELKLNFRCRTIADKWK